MSYIYLGAQKPSYKISLGQSKQSISNNTAKADRQQSYTKSKAQHQSDLIVKSVEATEQDARQILNLCIDRQERIEKIRLNSDNSQQKILDLQTVNDDFEKGLKGILTPAQYQKYEEMKKR